MAAVLGLALSVVAQRFRGNDVPAPDPMPPARPAPVAALRTHAVAEPPSSLFQVQVGSFRESGNADRLVDQLRREGLDAESEVAEGRRVLHRLFAVPPEGDDAEGLVERLRDLGFSPAVEGGVVAITGFVPPDEADAVSHRLADERFSIHVERQTHVTSYHVVRVGQYHTAEEAERARSELAARGHAGHVVQGTPGPR